MLLLILVKPITRYEETMACHSQLILAQVIPLAQLCFLNLLDVVSAEGNQNSFTCKVLSFCNPSWLHYIKPRHIITLCLQ